MSIRDFSGWSDEQVPIWVLDARIKDRNRAARERRVMCTCEYHFGSRKDLLAHCEATGHPPKEP